MTIELIVASANAIMEIRFNRPAKQNAPIRGVT
jgi:hypothetical protein